MFKKMLFKSVAGATALGSAFAVSLVATPAMVTSAPEIRNVACNIAYPQSVATNTQLSLVRTAGQYGLQNSATVRVVRTDSAGRNPVGRAVIRVVGVRNYTVRLTNGEATVNLPRLNARQTYTVRARYVPPGCSVFAPSASAPSYYTVIRAGVRLNVNAPNVRRNVRPRVNVTATSLTGMTPPGRVRVRLYREAVQVGAKWASLNRNGQTRVFFPRKRPGYYQAKVFYPASQNFSQASGENDARILRRS
jgi:hypothetical protein